MKVISAIESNYILAWLCNQQQKDIRLRHKISETYLHELRQELKTRYSVVNIAVYILIKKLTPTERKRMWSNVRAARYRQRKRDNAKPESIDITKSTYRQLCHMRQKLMGFDKDVSIDETIRYLLATSSGHN